VQTIDVIPYVTIFIFIVSAMVSLYFYVKSVQPAALEKKIGDRAWGACKRYRLISGLFMFVNFFCYIAYFLFPLQWLPVVFPWDYWVSVLIAVLIAIPSGYLFLLSIKAAGEEAMTPKKEHKMYQGIYKKIRHPMALGELQFVWVFALMLNSPVLLVLSVIWVPIFYYMCIAEEKDLLIRYGEDYREYMKTTGRFIPRGLGL
jgi:protein-S-isoprenylcysteine O-methyltransferase Ste14